MIGGDVFGLDALDDLAAELGRARDLDVAPLAAAVAKIVADDIRARLAAGRTAAGSGFAPLAESTIRQRHGSSTRPGGDLGDTLTVDIDIQSERVEVTTGWAGEQAKKAQFFSEGTVNMPARPLQGVSAEAEAKINRAIDDFLRAAFDGR